MKWVFKRVIFHTASLTLTTFLIDSFVIHGGWIMYVGAGTVLFLLSLLVRPILKIIMLPFNLITLGVGITVVNALVLFMLTKLIPFVLVNPYHFPGFSYNGFNIPALSFGIIPTYLIVGTILSVISSVLLWL